MKFQIKRKEDTLRIQTALFEIIKDIEAGKTYDVEIKEHKEKRSKNANDYSWVLQDKIAKALNMSLDEIHTQMVLDYGVVETFSIKAEAFDSAKRVFDYFKILGESEAKGSKFIHVRAGIGTHHYNTSEMATFINGVVQEAQQLGIETKTPAELAELMDLWKQGKR